ncbi:hypothetical protein GCM10011396_50860 [Undibacterium terreum]|uniref:Uncharacterized protein n=1 Tax=Undibacterium terreum TaxID=1224302 RepID=A0A916V071_9BURK|nr:hypothetical protein GCM10011396_50860 [Undibacterium terreum]
MVGIAPSVGAGGFALVAHPLTTSMLTDMDKQANHFIVVVRSVFTIFPYKCVMECLAFSGQATQPDMLVT